MNNFSDDPEVDELSNQYQEIVMKCLKSKGHLPPEQETYETPSDYSPFAVNMGQLTVHRFTLRCKCKKDLLKFGQACGRFVDYENQRWPAFMGRWANAKFDFGQSRAR